MTSAPNRKAALCCTRDQAWAWVDLLTAEALSGDRFSRRLLPRAVRHALVIEASA